MEKEWKKGINARKKGETGKSTKRAIVWRKRERGR